MTDVKEGLLVADCFNSQSGMIDAIPTVALIGEPSEVRSMKLALLDLLGLKKEASMFSLRKPNRRGSQRTSLEGVEGLVFSGAKIS